MTCKKIRDLIPLAAGADLEVAEQREVESHLKSCLACMREFRAFAAVRAALLVEEAPLERAAPVGLAESIRAAIAAEAATASAHCPAVALGPSGPTAWLRWALPIAAALVLSASAGFYWSSARTSAPPVRIPDFGPRPALEVSAPAPDEFFPLSDYVLDRGAPELKGSGAWDGHLRPWRTRALPPANIRYVQHGGDDY